MTFVYNSVDTLFIQSYIYLYNIDTLYQYINIVNNVYECIHLLYIYIIIHHVYTIIYYLYNIDTLYIRIWKEFVGQYICVRCAIIMLWTNMAQFIINSPIQDPLDTLQLELQLLNCT